MNSSTTAFLFRAMLIVTIARELCFAGHTLRLWIFECRHPSYEAFKLGMVATVLLTLAHVAAVMLSGCVCIGSREELDQSSNIKRLAAASHVLAWYEITFIAFCRLSNNNYRLVNNKELRNCL